MFKSLYLWFQVSSFKMYGMSTLNKFTNQHVTYFWVSVAPTLIMALGNAHKIGFNTLFISTGTFNLTLILKLVCLFILLY